MDSRLTRARLGFTLVEVLISVTLFGLISAIAFAPAVAVVRRFEDVRAEEAAEQRMEYLLRRVPREMRLSPAEFGDGPAVVLVKKDVLGGAADDRLAFWSDFGGEAGVRALRVVRRGVGWTGEAGVYIWILPLAEPESVNWDMLDPAEGRLLMAGVDSLRFEALDFESGEWSGEYSGRRPRGIRITVRSGEEEFSHEDWLPPR
jgi:prepilin-type N-terminal cleavage/methylation domain-containing protein